MNHFRSKGKIHTKEQQNSCKIAEIINKEKRSLATFILGGALLVLLCLVHLKENNIHDNALANLAHTNEKTVLIGHLQILLT